MVLDVQVLKREVSTLKSSQPYWIAITTEMKKGGINSEMEPYTPSIKCCDQSGRFLSE